MTHTKRTTRAFRPMGDSLESRLVLSSSAATAGHALVPADRHPTHPPAFVFPVSFTVSGAESITVGAPTTPTTVPLSSGTGAPVPSTTLQIHVLAPNDLDAANLALSKIPYGIPTTVTITIRPGKVTTPKPKKPTSTTPKPTPTTTTTPTTTPTTTITIT